jgi:hypothetical protein
MGTGQEERVWVGVPQLKHRWVCSDLSSKGSWDPMNAVGCRWNKGGISGPEVKYGAEPTLSEMNSGVSSV